MWSRCVYLVLFMAVFGGAGGVSCRLGSDVVVDWYFVSKAPGCTNTSLPECSMLYTYSSLSSVGASTSGTVSPMFFFSNVSAVRGSALEATVRQLSANRRSTGRFLWNDDPPLNFTKDAQSSSIGKSNGHSKGVLGADADGGFWLTHSWPEWPDLRSIAPDWGGIGDASTIYGQSFLCVSLSPPAVDAVARALIRAEPRGYDSEVPPSLVGLYPGLADLAAGIRTTPKNATILTVNSKAEAQFMFFSKNGAWGGELWSDLVAPALVVRNCSGLRVETWRRSPILESECNASSPRVTNVNQIRYTANAVPIVKMYTVDHSKWGISETPSWICVGDINRMASQASRGGGAVCFDHAPALWAVINASISVFDACANATMCAASILPLSSRQSSATASVTSSIFVTSHSSASPPAVYKLSQTASVTTPALTTPSAAAESSKTASTLPAALTSTLSTLPAALTSSPTQTLAPSPTPSPPPTETLRGLDATSNKAFPQAASTPVIVGSSVGAAAFVAMVVAVTVLFSTRRKQRERSLVAVPVATADESPHSAVTNPMHNISDNRWEAIVDNGDTYYRNVATGESVWDLPLGASIVNHDTLVREALQAAFEKG